MTIEEHGYGIHIMVMEHGQVDAEHLRVRKPRKMGQQISVATDHCADCSVDYARRRSQVADVISAGAHSSACIKTAVSSLA